MLNCTKKSWLLSSLILICFSYQAIADQPDKDLLEAINKIKVIDGHSHYMTMSLPKTSRKLMGEHPFEHPVGLSLDNPHWIGAWQALWGYQHNDMDESHIEELLKKKAEIVKAKGPGLATWVMDKVGVEAALINLPMLSPGMEGPRFRQVMLVDFYLNPFEPRYARGGPGAIPPGTDMPKSLDDYMNNIVLPTLEGFKKRGVIALKIGLAYMRPLNFQVVSQEDAADSYQKMLASGSDAPTEFHRTLEDYIYSQICKKAGELGLPMNIHVGVGASDRFNFTGSNPLLLETVIDHPEQANTQFVLIHGGWPFDEQAGAMLIKPNVYIDFSDQTFLRSPRAVSRSLRSWMEWYPHKIMFGSDAYPDPNTPLANWEEKLYVTTKAARTAVAMALTGMIKDGQISEERALEIANMTLRTTAIEFYGLDWLK